MAISRDKKGNWEADKKSGGPPKWLSVVSPISNLARLKKGGKVRSKKKRMKARS
jgi:hypothetical protein